MRKLIKSLLIFALAVIALVVSVGLYHEQNMWPWIVSYWVVLTVSNFHNWFWR